jgi:hypothetical protein
MAKKVLPKKFAQIFKQVTKACEYWKVSPQRASGLETVYYIDAKHPNNGQTRDQYE